MRRIEPTQADRTAKKAAERAASSLGVPTPINLRSTVPRLSAANCIRWRLPTSITPLRELVAHVQRAR